MSLGLWPQVSVFLVSHVKGTIVYIGKKWIKIKGQLHYWFVVLDHTTGLPIIAESMGSPVDRDSIEVYQDNPAGYRHRWAYQLPISPRRGDPSDVFVPPPTAGDTLAEETLCRKSRDCLAKAIDETPLSNLGQTHGQKTLGETQSIS